MVINTLDQWVGTSSKPTVISDTHADYLYEQSFNRQLEKLYDAQIQRFLEEERAKEQVHKDYTEKNYVRVGGN